MQKRCIHSLRINSDLFPTLPLNFGLDGMMLNAIFFSLFYQLMKIYLINDTSSYFAMLSFKFDLSVCIEERI